jgi:hypothetical protein
MYESKVLRKVSVSRKDLVSEQFSLIYNEILNDLCRSPSAVRIVRPGRPLQHVGKRTNIYTVFGGGSSLRRLREEWEENIKEVTGAVWIM